jgi:hypothetical protein
VGIGLGLILLALELIVQAVTPHQANGVQVIFASLTGDIMLDADWRGVCHRQLLQPGGRLLTPRSPPQGRSPSRWRCVW